MFGQKFQLNEQTLSIVEEIGKHMPGGFFIYRDNESEDLIYANNAVVRIFGCNDLDEFKELTGFTFKGIVHPDDYPAVVSNIKNQIDNTDETEEKLDYVEYRIICKDGSIRWVDDYGHYTETDAYGGIFYVFISDITKKHQILEAIEHSKEEGDKMITAMASDYRAVYHVDLDADDAVCYRNDPNDSEQTPQGVHFRYLERFRYYGNEFVDPEFREGFLRFIEPDNVRERLATEVIIAYRYLVRRDGKEYYEMIRMAGVRHPKDRDDNTVHAVGLGLTIIDTEMRESMMRNRALAEALAVAEEANKAKTAFLSSMSHEIRTPMNAIIGYSKLALRDDNIQGESRDYLEKISRSAGHLLELINDILDMSRIEAGRMSLNKSPFSLREMLRQIDAIVSAQCADKGIAYTSEVDEALDDSLYGDSMKLKQVLINILGNAVKFTYPGGEIHSRTRMINRYKDQITVSFAIEDSGIGMDSEFIPKIFDSFSQEDSGRTSKYGSTGLGMAITKSIVDLMDGTISVRSEKGVGSEFTVVVTLRKIDMIENAGPGAGVAHADLYGRRVLIAEDIMINAEILQKVLEDKGIVTEHAANGLIALNMFKESGIGYYDAVLMDIRMPEMDGLDATRNIRKLDREDAKTVTIIAMTANAFDEDVKRSLQAGMNAHLSKPIDAKLLYDTLERFMATNK